MGSFDTSKVPFWKITPLFILKLKTMFCNNQIIILIACWQYLSMNYVFLLHFQIQTCKGFFSQMNLIQITLWSQLDIYSLNALLCIRISGLTFSTGNMSRNVSINGVTPGNIDSVAASARYQKIKVKHIKMTAYWFFKYFVNLFQIWELWYFPIWLF